MMASATLPGIHNREYGVLGRSATSVRKLTGMAAAIVASRSSRNRLTLIAIRPSRSARATRCMPSMTRLPGSRMTGYDGSMSLMRRKCSTTVRTVGRPSLSNEYSSTFGRSPSATSAAGKSAASRIRLSTSHASIPPSPGQECYCFLIVPVWYRSRSGVRCDTAVTVAGHTGEAGIASSQACTQRAVGPLGGRTEYEPVTGSAGQAGRA